MDGDRIVRDFCEGKDAIRAFIRSLIPERKISAWRDYFDMKQFTGQ